MKQEDTNRSTMNIQWYPGHMTKTRRMIEADVKLVDAVCEILDARIPLASRNPDIDAICGTKPRMIILNRIDMADPAMTKRWAEHFRARGYSVLQTDCKTKKGISGFVPAVRELLAEMHELYRRGYTPKVKPTKSCNACSLKELCLPKLMKSRAVSAYLRAAMEESP